MHNGDSQIDKDRIIQTAKITAKTLIEDDYRAGDFIGIEAVTCEEKVRIIYTFLTMKGSKPAKIHFYKSAASYNSLFGEWVQDIEEFTGKNAPTFEEFGRLYEASQEKIISGVWVGNSGKVTLKSVEDLNYVAISFCDEGEEKLRIETEFNEAFNKASNELQMKNHVDENKSVNNGSNLLAEHLIDFKYYEHKEYSYLKKVCYTEYCATFKIKEITIPESEQIEFINYLLPYVHFTNFHFTEYDLDEPADLIGLNNEEWIEEGYDDFRKAYYTKEWSYFESACETIPGNYDIIDISIKLYEEETVVYAKCRCTSGLSEFEQALKRAASDAMSKGKIELIN